MKIGDRCFVHGYVDEIRKDTVIIKNKGGYFGTDPGEVITVYDTTHPNWIPCEEKLPEDVEVGQEYPTVLYSTNSGEVAAGWYEVLTRTWWRESASDDVIKDKVIAWMPLPEPWEGENRQK